MVKPTICNSDSKTPVIPEFCDDGLWEVPVNSLSEIKKADRDHAYILPDDSVWVLSHDGKSFIRLNLGGGSGEGQPTQVENTDGFLSVDGSGTYDVSVDLNLENLKEHVITPEIEKNLSDKQDKLTAGIGIKIAENEISGTGQLAKITADDGSAFLQVADNETIISAIVSAGAGVRSGVASAKVSDNPTSTNMIMFVANMVTSSGGYVIGTNTAGLTWTRAITAKGWSGDWQQLASTRQAQMSKITSDNGSVYKGISSGTILEAVLAEREGFRNYHAYGAVTDLPSKSVFRFTANMSTTSGNVTGMDDLGNFYARAISDSKWKGDWQKIINGSPDNDTQYWAYFNPTYDQISVGAKGDKRGSTVYLAGKFYSESIYLKLEDTTYWYIDFSLKDNPETSNSNLIVYRSKEDLLVDFEYNLENDYNTMMLKNRKFSVYGGLTIMTNNDKVLALNTNSLNLGTLSSDFSYFLIQSLNFFTIKLRIESGFFIQPKEGAILKTQNYKNKPQITREIRNEDFAFDVAVKANPAMPGEYKPYTLTGYYQMIKKPEDGSYDFTLALTGLFSWSHQIPYDDSKILEDPNNVFSPQYVGNENEYEFQIRQKTVFL